MHFAATATATATQRQQLQQRQPSLSSACVCMCVCAILRRMSSIRSVDKLANDRSIARPIQLQFWPRGSFDCCCCCMRIKAAAACLPHLVAVANLRSTPPQATASQAIIRRGAGAGAVESGRRRCQASPWRCPAINCRVNGLRSCWIDCGSQFR